MSSAGVERRIAPRFAVSCLGELASGNAVLDVQVSNMSVTGCGIEMAGIPDPVSGSLGRTGVLNVRAEAGTVMLPVAISNQRSVEGRTLIGLQFRQLSMQQMRSLIKVLDSVIDK